jgi:hypothetical protein
MKFLTPRTETWKTAPKFLKGRLVVNLLYICPNRHTHERSGDAWSGVSSAMRQYETTTSCPECGEPATLQGLELQ